jgi:hypothetical protein
LFGFALYRFFHESVDQPDYRFSQGRLNKDFKIFVDDSEMRKQEKLLKELDARERRAAKMLAKLGGALFFGPGRI